MGNHSSRSVWAVGLLAATAVQVQAQEQVFADIAPCMVISANAERYACYDKIASAVQAGQQRAQPASAEVNQSAALPPPQAEVAAFGTSSATQTSQRESRNAELENGVAAKAAAKVVTTDEGGAELHDTVTAVKEREPGRYLITLASGQVWYQTNSQRMRLQFSKGTNIRIYRSPLGGSWRMASTDEGVSGFIQVQRIE